MIHTTTTSVFGLITLEVGFGLDELGERLKTRQDTVSLDGWMDNNIFIVE